MRSILQLSLAVLTISAGFVSAETATISTTTTGTVAHHYSLAIAKAADEKAGLDLRPKPYKSTGQGAVFVNKGEVDFGLHNAIILREAYLGLEFYKDRPLSNLRAVARLAPLQVTLSVPGSSDIQRIEDMAGKRFPAGFDATAFAERLYEALLGTGGLSYDDVEKVQVSDWKGLGKAFIKGDVDVGGLVVGSATSARYAELVEGYRGISLNDGPGVEKALKDIFPASRLATVEPAEGLAGILEPTVVLEFDYWIFAHKDTPDKLVTDVLTGLSEGKETLVSVSKDFRHFDPAAMNDDIGVPLHPAAEAFYASN